MSPIPPLAVYIHWPYCARICPYCDFNVVRERGRTLQQEALVAAITDDLKSQAKLIGPRRLTSIFFGGGTPSLMRPEWVAQLIAVARDLWPTDDAVEISLEANPTDAESGRFADLAAAGVHRLSLGVQAFDDAALTFLGRNHDAAQGRRALDAALAAFARVSIDLIYALPGQTELAWRDALTHAAGLGVEHISPYQLTIEAGTAFDRLVRRKVFTPPDPDLGAALYETTQDVLLAAGFTAYEVSNHARGEAARSQHNLAYWRGWDYVGAGPGAHGRLSYKGLRFALLTASKIEDYLVTALEDAVPLTPREVAIERLLMGLRTLEGVGIDELAALKLTALDDLKAAGLAFVDRDRLFATQNGRAVLDRVTAELTD